MTINTKDLEHDLTFLSENPTQGEVKAFTERWLEIIYDSKTFEQKIEDNMKIIQRRLDKLLENTEKLVEEMKG